MKVSIITTVFNNKETIEDTILSVLSQSYPDIEYIVVDGGSTDGTLDVIKKYQERIDKFVSEKDRGLFDGLNKGIKMAEGEIIGILHSDDLFFNKDVIGKVVEKMSSKKADLCWGDLVYVKRDNPEKIVRYWKSSSYEKGLFKKGWMPPHTTFFAKKEAFEKYGYYNLDLDMAADYELMLRFLEKEGLSSCYIPEVLVKMRVGGVSDRSFKNIKQIIKNNFDCLRAWKVNNMKVNPFNILVVKPFSKVFQRVKK